MTEVKIINGYPDNTFRPNSEVTFGMALRWILSVSGVPNQPPSGTHWASGYMHYALDNGILPHSVDLNALPTREEIASIIVDVLKLPTTALESPYANTDNPDVIALFNANIMKGYMSQSGIRTFKPISHMKRSEMAAIISNIYEYIQNH